MFVYIVQDASAIGRQLGGQWLHRIVSKFMLERAGQEFLGKRRFPGNPDIFVSRFHSSTLKGPPILDAPHFKIMWVGLDDYGTYPFLLLILFTGNIPDPHHAILLKYIGKRDVGCARSQNSLHSPSGCLFFLCMDNICGDSKDRRLIATVQFERTEDT